MGTSFEMIKYHNRVYPADIPLRIEEIAANLDVSGKVHSELKMSLHTEYSYGKRNLNTFPVKDYPELVARNKDRVPCLWHSPLWADQFSRFIMDLVDLKTVPAVIEIHPPFNDYTDMDGFISSYMEFEQQITDQWPDVEILLENRCGSVYRGGKFLISTIPDILSLCEKIAANNLRLKIAYDIPQIYSASNIKSDIDYLRILNRTTEFREFIGGVHLWGKGYAKTGRRVAHYGDLNSYFDGNTELKQRFLNGVAYVFNDDVPRNENYESRREFELEIRSFIVSSRWYNRSKYGFEVYSGPRRLGETIKVGDIVRVTHTFRGAYEGESSVVISVGEGKKEGWYAVGFRGLNFERMSQDNALGQNAMWLTADDIRVERS